MKALVTRVSTICAAVALAGAVTAAPAAAQDTAAYTCATGIVFTTIDWLTGVAARDCTGPGASDGAPGGITLPTETYVCRFVYFSPENGYLYGRDCY
ncbi:hypothetical protein [Microbispora sp. H10836]|uniref:hypothetical protein n=1 Tax=Microbispora sp. H10836 TaxID=2729106 RepID=UPI001474D203|nr:hypothetical protein [Microbispora sp. H10836]